MWQIIAASLPIIAKRLTLPIAVVIGFIGYVAEACITDKYTPSIPSVQEERQERQEKQLTEVEVDSLKEKKFVPKTIFEKNLSPSLLIEDDRGKK